MSTLRLCALGSHDLRIKPYKIYSILIEICGADAISEGLYLICDTFDFNMTSTRAVSKGYIVQYVKACRRGWNRKSQII